MSEAQIQHWLDVLRAGLPAPSEMAAAAATGSPPPPPPDAPPIATAVLAAHGHALADLPVALPDEAADSGDGSAAPPSSDGENLDDFLSGLGK